MATLRYRFKTLDEKTRPLKPIRSQSYIGPTTMGPDVQRVHRRSICCYQFELEKIVKMFIDMEDADITVDLRHFNSSFKGKYDLFW